MSVIKKYSSVCNIRFSILCCDSSLPGGGNFSYTINSTFSTQRQIRKIFVILLGNNHERFMKRNAQIKICIFKGTKLIEYIIRIDTQTSTLNFWGLWISMFCGLNSRWTKVDIIYLTVEFASACVFFYEGENCVFGVGCEKTI